MKKANDKPLTTLKQVDVVVLSVCLLGGDHKAIDTEEIAVKSHALAPGMFSWRRYPEQINLELIRVALSDAKKKQNGSLLQGAGREGWRLTTRGLEWCQRILPTLSERGVQFVNKPRQAGSVDSRRIDRERLRITNSPAWGIWSETGDISLLGAKQLFRIDGYSNRTMAEAKIVRLQSMFQSDADVKSFLELAGKAVLELKEEGSV